MRFCISLGAADVHVACHRVDYLFISMCTLLAGVSVSSMEPIRSDWSKKILLLEGDDGGGGGREAWVAAGSSAML